MPSHPGFFHRGAVGSCTMEKPAVLSGDPEVLVAAFHCLFDCFGAPAMLVGADKVVRAVNPRLLGLAGREASHFVGRALVDAGFDLPDTALELLAGGDAVELRWRLEPENTAVWTARALAAASPGNLAVMLSPTPRAMRDRHGALVAARKTGEVFPVEISLAPIETVGGRVIAAAIRDVTAQRRAESARQAAEQRLRQTQKMESLGTLAGGIAHDFNNILTGMLGFVELAQLQMPDGHEAKAWLHQTTEAGLRAKGLVQQILTFGRRQESLLAPIRMQKVAAEALALIRSTLPASVRLVAEIDDGCPPVLADASQLYQVFVNLCTNATQALPPTGGRVTVRLTVANLTPEQAALPAGMPAGEVVCFSVEDDGCGIVPEALDRTFDPFYTTKAPGRGTGLGLAVVDSIVRSHRGAVTVRSRLGEGSLFCVHLLALPIVPLGSAAQSRSVAPEGDGECVLVVDDQAESRTAIVGIIEHLGYKVVEHAHPRSALEEFLKNPERFNAVVTDFAMPSMSGRELARQVLARAPLMPVMLISGYIDQAEVDDMRALGVREILRKPVAFGELAVALRGLLAPAQK